jgi:hypothetical protein
VGLRQIYGKIGTPPPKWSSGYKTDLTTWAVYHH